MVKSNPNKMKKPESGGKPAPGTDAPRGGRRRWDYSASVARAASSSLSTMPNFASASLLTYRPGSVMIS